MHCIQALPEGYREILALDLQKDKKAALIVNGLSLIPFFLFLYLGLIQEPIRLSVDSSHGLGIYFLRLGVMLAGTIAYVVLHELTHAAVMKAYGARKLRFGFTGLYAYAGSVEDFFDKQAHRNIALAPVLLWLAIFWALSALVPRDWFWVVWFWQIMNVAGAAGDIFVTLRFLTLPRDILVKDTGVSMTIYSAK